MQTTFRGSELAPWHFLLDTKKANHGRDKRTIYAVEVDEEHNREALLAASRVCHHTTVS